MFTKLILSAVLAACGVQSNQVKSPDASDPAAIKVSGPHEDSPPPKPPIIEDATYFCCDSVSDGKKGEGCQEIPGSHVVLCEKVLKCPDGYSNDDGKVTCA
jgi:hypothetical protein